jgi:hypothetical protein
LGIVDSSDAVIPVPRIGGCLAALVSDAMHIMAVVVVAVMNSAAAGMRDSEDFPNPVGRRRAASVGRGVNIRVCNRIDIPVAIVPKMVVCPRKSV